MPKYRLGQFRGKYCAVSWEDGTRRRYTLKTTDKAVAQSEIDRLNREAETAPGQTVDVLWEAYRKDKEGRVIAERMIDTWKALKGTFEGREAETIGDETVRDYIAIRRKPDEKFPNGRSDGTIWTELNHLRIVLSWAEKKGRISKAPHIEQVAKPEPRDRWLTRQEVNSLKDNATTEHIRLFIILAIATGGRRDALLQLTWDRVDFENGIIHLADKSNVRRKGRASVPMNKTIRAALQDARRAATCEYVIEWDGKPIKSVKRSLAKTGEKANINGVTAHVFRHSAAVWMASEGIPMAKIAQYLGHSDSRITERVYARYSPHHMMDAAEALELDFVAINGGRYRD